MDFRPTQLEIVCTVAPVQREISRCPGDDVLDESPREQDAPGVGDLESFCAGQVENLGRGIAHSNTFENLKCTVGNSFEVTIRKRPVDSTFDAGPHHPRPLELRHLPFGYPRLASASRRR